VAVLLLSVEDVVNRDLKKISIFAAIKILVIKLQLDKTPLTDGMAQQT